MELHGSFQSHLYNEWVFSDPLAIISPDTWSKDFIMYYDMTEDYKDHNIYILYQLMLVIIMTSVLVEGLSLVLFLK